MGGDEYAAIEGCHRLRAAAELGIMPALRVLDYDTIAQLDVTNPALELDLDNPGMTVADLVDSYNRRKCLEF